MLKQIWVVLIIFSIICSSTAEDTPLPALPNISQDPKQTAPASPSMLDKIKSYIWPSKKNEPIVKEEIIEPSKNISDSTSGINLIAPAQETLHTPDSSKELTLDKPQTEDTKVPSEPENKITDNPTKQEPISPQEVKQTAPASPSMLDKIKSYIWPSKKNEPKNEPIVKEEILEPSKDIPNIEDNTDLAKPESEALPHQDKDIKLDTPETELIKTPLPPEDKITNTPTTQEPISPQALENYKPAETEATPIEGMQKKDSLPQNPPSDPLNISDKDFDLDKFQNPPGQPTPVIIPESILPLAAPTAPATETGNIQPAPVVNITQTPAPAAELQTAPKANENLPVAGPLNAEPTSNIPAPPIVAPIELPKDLAPIPEQNSETTPNGIAPAQPQRETTIPVAPAIPNNPPIEPVPATTNESKAEEAPKSSNINDKKDISLSPIVNQPPEGSLNNPSLNISESNIIPTPIDIIKDKEFKGTMIQRNEDLPQTPIKLEKETIKSLKPKEEAKHKPEPKTLPASPEDIEVDKFVENELIMLQLKEDEDVVLGSLTENAKNDLMDFNSYVELFWKNISLEKGLNKKQKIDKFLKDYDDKFYGYGILTFIKPEEYNNTGSEIPLYENDLRQAAINAATSGDLDSLRVWIDNYPLLNIYDDEGNNLLAIAVLNGHGKIVKYLLEKGIEYRNKNNNNENALDIALARGNNFIIKLLRSAEKPTPPQSKETISGKK
jgi:hypothetical protein